MILWNNENDLFEFVKPPSVESLFYGDIEGSTCYSGEQKALAFRAYGSYNCRLRRHKRMESRRNWFEGNSHCTKKCPNGGDDCNLIL